MITMTDAQLQKIDLLDKLFGALSVEQLKEFTESEQVVARLKGTDQNPSILKRLVQEHDLQQMTINTLQNDLWSLKSDLQTVIKIIVKPTDSYVVSEFNNLKMKHGVY